MFVPVGCFGKCCCYKWDDVVRIVGVVVVIGIVGFQVGIVGKV